MPGSQKNNYKKLHTAYTRLPVFPTEASVKMNFFDTTENLSARVEIYQANFKLND